MRTLFCCAAALVGAGLIGVSASADFVTNFPCAAEACVGAAVSHVSIGRSVVSGVVTTTTRRCEHALLGKQEVEPPCPDHAQVAPPEPTPLEPEHQEGLPLWVHGLDPIGDEAPAGKGEDIKADHRGVNEVPCPEGQLPGEGIGDAEECEPTPDHMPLIGDGQAPAKKTSEPPVPGCPCCKDRAMLSDILGSFLFKLGREMVGDHPEGSEEESEISKPGAPPNCREDPDHDRQYPGCPHLDSCPAGKHAPKQEKQESKDESAAPKQAEDEDGPGQPRVDTMEFRPSDAKRGEFDRIPF